MPSTLFCISPKGGCPLHGSVNLNVSPKLSSFVFYFFLTLLRKIEGKGRRPRTEDEMVGWHHKLNGLEIVQTQEDTQGPGSLVCCSSRGPRESDTTWPLNNN